jgi:hypothetical protein
MNYGIHQVSTNILQDAEVKLIILTECALKLIVLHCIASCFETDEIRCLKILSIIIELIAGTNELIG